VTRRRQSSKRRCAWAAGDPLLAAYHDEEWGVPSLDDRHLFELLTLEGAQAGLSWLTILRKRAGYRRAFAGFDPRKVARFTARDVARCLGDAGIVRHRGKIESVVANARAVLAVQAEHGSLSTFLWSLAGEPRASARRSLADVPSETPESKALSKALKKRGFRFVGSTTCYAFMQAVGMVNDHELACFRHREVQRVVTRRAR
jgi:DNA-3-methyladenine glycosylase I